MRNWPVTINTVSGEQLETRITLKEIKAFRKETITLAKEEMGLGNDVKVNSLPLKTWLMQYSIDFATHYGNGAVTDITVDVSRFGKL